MRRSAALDQLLHPTIDPSAEREVIATGLPRGVGKPCFTGAGALRVRLPTPVPPSSSVLKASGSAAPSICCSTRTEFAPCARWFWRKTRKPAASRWENSCRCSRADFVELFKIMGGLPVTIRLLDPPLHEFLPHSEEEIAQVAQTMGADPKKLANRARELHEFNPMLGFRGCRLAIAYPEITEMQARAIFEAAVEAGRATGVPVTPEIMVPLIASKAELDLVKERIDATAETVASETKSKIKYQVGTMIELPRAALQAGEIAETAEFFSFGTNDLTQTTFGISRDDAASFLGIYTSKGILAVDPFVSIDRDGVGELVRIATERGRKVRQKLKLGICGEHGGDPASVSFCHELGLDYVSCSPFRVPIARLAAAQAALGRGASSQA